MNPRDPRWPSDEDLDPDDSGADASSVALLRPAPRRGRSTFRTMETVLLASTAALLAAVAWPIATGGPSPAPPSPVMVAQPPAPSSVPAPKIQLALLLDTSSSMDGLIDQARSQLWAVVNALDSATFQGKAPQLEIAVYEYGNDGLPESEGYIRQVVPFSSELDVVSEGLFTLTTLGGDEFAGQVIARATTELNWTPGDNVLRVLYIAGNEAFDQGPVDFRETVAMAKAQGIVLNTVNCSGYDQWDAGWQNAARIGDGKALRIDQSAKAVYIPSPHDDEIERLSSRLNDTYIGYGSRGEIALENQAAQDSNSVASGRVSTIARAKSKTSMHYDNAQWDLVDAIEDGLVDLRKVPRDTLSEGYRDLDHAALTAKVTEAKGDRERIKAALRTLQQKREDFVASRQSEGGPRLDDAIIESITAQAASAGFTL